MAQSPAPGAAYADTQGPRVKFRDTHVLDGFLIWGSRELHTYMKIHATLSGEAYMKRTFYPAALLKSPNAVAFSRF